MVPVANGSGLRVVFSYEGRAVDWRERLGLALRRPLDSLQGYDSVTSDMKGSYSCTKIAGSLKNAGLLKKILSVALQILSQITALMGRTFLACSSSYQKELAQFNRWEREPSSLPAVETQFVTFGTAIETTIECVSVLEGILDGYAPLIDASTGPVPFLYQELLSLRKEVEVLASQQSKLRAKEKTKLGEADIDATSLTLNLALQQRASDLIMRYTEALLKVESPSEQQTRPSTTPGLENVGNTCYINSALQPLLAINNLLTLVKEPGGLYPSETQQEYAGRQSIFKAFQSFLKAWHEKKGPRELGQQVGNLRAEIFKAGLYEGGFIDRRDEYSYQDAGSFFELILYVIGQGFRLTTHRTFLHGVREVHAITETTPQGVLLLKSKCRSMQEKVLEGGQVLRNEVQPDEAYKWTDSERTEHRLTCSMDSALIEGEPKELLVIRVDDYQVNLETDRWIDCTPLFKTKPPSDTAHYELVGFAQNHEQVHWTSVTYSNGQWQHCNDSCVRPIEPGDTAFTAPASYLVYKQRRTAFS